MAEAGDAPVIAGTGTYDTRHTRRAHRARHRDRRRRRAGRHALLRAAQPARDQGPLRGRRRRHRPAGDRLQHPRPHGDRHAQRPARRARPDRERRRPSSRPATRTSRRSTGSTCWPATTTCSPRRMDIGGTGGILVASHLVGARDAPHRRRARAAATRSRTACATSTRRCTVTTNPIPIKAALNMAGHEVGGLRLPLVEADRGGEGRHPRGARAPRAARRGVTRRHPPGPAAGRARRDRQEHDGRRVRRPDRRGRHRADVPDARPARHRPGAARLRLPARAGRRHRGDRADPRARGPRRGAAVRAAPARTHAADLRRPADRRDGALEARRAPAASDVPVEDVLAGQTFEAGPFSVEMVKMAHSIPDSFAVGADLRARHDARHRRLQVRPDPGGRRARRRRPAGRAGPRGPAAAVRRLDQRRPARACRSRSRASGRSSRRCSPAAAGGSWSPASPRTSTACSRWSTPPPRSGRRVSLVGRSMRKNVNIGRMLGHIDVPEGMLVGPKEIEDFPDHKLVVISTGSQGEPLSALRRMAHGDHPQVELHDGRHGDLLGHADPRQRARGQRDDQPHLPARRRRDHRRATCRCTPRATATQEELKLMLNLTKPRVRDAGARRPPAPAPARRAGRGGRHRRRSRSSAGENGLPLEIDASRGALRRPRAGRA